MREAETLWTVFTSTDAATEPPLPPEGEITTGARYQQKGLIGRGGVGEVWRVFDRTLQRDLVRKDLRPDLGQDERAVRRFINEARITAHLQHPGVVPVLDVGVHEDGRPYYTMQEVRGPRLGDVLVLAREARLGWDLRRLVEAVRRVAEVVAMAHARGVLHRDLKPDNVMVGEFGEVLVLDWGVALAQPPVGQEEFPGMVVGTLPYLAPELLLGAPGAMAPTVDVFSLGALMYQVLTGRLARRGTGSRTLAEVAATPIAPLPLAVDRGLAAICARCLAPSPADRFPDAAPLAAALAAWLAGHDRRERALAVVAEAERFAARRAELEAEAADLTHRAAVVLAPLRSFDAATDKQPGWTLQDRAAALRAEAALAGDQQEQALQAALRVDAELPEAHRELAALYRAQHEDAERGGDVLLAARLEQRLRTHDRGAHQAYLAGQGALTLQTDPPGAEVWLYRYTSQHRRLEPVPVGSLGTTPLHEVPLPRGSYLLELRHPATAEVRYPVRIDRAERWHGVPPGATEPRPIALPSREALHADDCYVPAGWFDAGGDPGATDGLPRRRVWVEGFVMRRFPVTHGEFLEFLNALVAQDRADEAARWAPLHDGGVVQGSQRGYTRRADGSYGLAVPGAEPGWTSDMPAVWVSWRAASAFCAWRGCGARLPSSDEWEKAARGVDGRVLPWGSFLEPSWAAIVDGFAGAPLTPPVHAFPLDVSPYGVRGLVGGVRDLCGDVYTRDGAVPDSDDPNAWRNVRGGMFQSGGALVRAATRLAARPDQVFGNVGFRYVRPWDRPPPDMPMAPSEGRSTA